MKQFESIADVEPLENSEDMLNNSNFTQLLEDLDVTPSIRSTSAVYTSRANRLKIQFEYVDLDEETPPEDYTKLTPQEQIPDEVIDVLTKAGFAVSDAEFGHTGRFIFNVLVPYQG